MGFLKRDEGSEDQQLQAAAPTAPEEGPHAAAYQPGYYPGYYQGYYPNPYTGYAPVQQMGGMNGYGYGHGY